MSRPAAELRDEVGDAFGGGVGAVGAAEGVVDVDVAEGGELLGEGGVVGLLFGMEAEVFEQQGLAGLEVGGDISMAISPTQSGEKATFSSSSRTWSSRVRRRSTSGRRLMEATGLPLGRPRCEARMTLALWRRAYSMVGRVSRMRVSSSDGAAVLGEGNVEVDADEDALVSKVEIADRKLGHKWNQDT